MKVQSCGGYDSVTEKHKLAKWIAESDRPVTVLHVGDLDPSGEDMFSNLSRDIPAFVSDMPPSYHCEKTWLDMVRIAVTREQAEALNLPTQPPKKDDPRTANFEGETVQCEAVPPDVLAEIVREAIVSRLDMDVFDANLDVESESASRSRPRFPN